MQITRARACRLSPFGAFTDAPVTSELAPLWKLAADSAARIALRDADEYGSRISIEGRVGGLGKGAKTGRQGKSVAIRRAQWIGMIELFGHPQNDPCHTF
jgi:hypothetical protein